MDRRSGRRSSSTTCASAGPVVVPDDDEGAEVTVRGTVAALLDDGRARVDLTVTSGGEKVLSLARAIVRLA